MNDKLKEALTKLKDEALKLLKKTKQAEQFDLGEGKTLTLDPGVEVGATAMINEAPAPDGEYQMPDGMVIVVAAGVVSEVRPAMPMDMTAQVAEIVKRLDKIEAEHKSIPAQFKEDTEKTNKVLSDLLTLMEQVVNSTVEKPVERKPVQFKAIGAQPTDETMKRIKENMAKFNN